MSTDYLSTPIGLIEIVASDSGVQKIAFCDNHDSAERLRNIHANSHTNTAKSQLVEYFSGLRQQFDLTLVPEGTPFQQTVWHALTNIPHGKTASYSDIADQINNPKAVRAIGAANGRNPIAIVIPCHRIIGKDGSLTGYAGGLERKAYLLELERN